MNAEQNTLPEGSKPSTAEGTVDYLNALTDSGKATFLSLSIFLAFCTITTLSITDRDLFSSDLRISLPIVDTSVPISSFFLLAPVVALCMHTYLQLIVCRVVASILDLPSQHLLGSIGATTPTDAPQIKPWLVNDLAVRIRPCHCIESQAPASTFLNAIGAIATALLVWFATPTIIMFIWIKSLPAHNEWSSQFIVCCLTFSILASLSSFKTAVIEKGRRSEGKLRYFLFPVLPISIILSLATVANFILTDTELPKLGASLMARADLRGMSFTDLKRDHISDDISRRTFDKEWCTQRSLSLTECVKNLFSSRINITTQTRATWCKKHSIPSDVDCKIFFSQLDSQRENDWASFKRSSILAAKRADLSTTDLRNSDLSNSNLAGVSLRDAQLRGSIIRESNFSFSDLSSTDLRDANLRLSVMAGANLRWSNLDGANLRWMDFSNADMREAKLRGSDLRWTRLNLANLIEADAELANFSEADLQGASLLYANLRFTTWSSTVDMKAAVHSADFRGAIGLTQQTLDGLIGNANTLLPTDPPDLHVWSCWKQAPEDFDKMIRDAVEFTKKTETQLRSEWLCQGAENPVKVGKPTTPP